MCHFLEIFQYTYNATFRYQNLWGTPPRPTPPPPQKKKCNIQLYTKVTWNLGQTLPC